MTMNTEQVVSILKTKLHAVKTVEANILRGEKRYHDRTFAVFFVDVTGRIEECAKNLSEYQDRLLGRHYFDSPNDLRWNSYLLLLADKIQFEGTAFKKARATIEADRNYARKFVITPEELVSRVDVQSEASQPIALQSSDLLTTWANILSPAGLNDIFGDGDIAPLIRGIASKPPSQSPLVTISAPNLPDNDLIASTPLHKIELEHFRAYPRVTQFECGRVNLIRGVNGVGKTTLLEAIEYFYCGATRRPGVPKGARILGWLKNTEPPMATSAQTPPQTFRDRALSWYGKLGLRGNPLPEAFSIYNFLNTDAAVHLTTENDPAQRERDLATLLMGAEVGRVWGRIERVAMGVPTERRGFERQVEALRAKVKAEQERLDAAQGIARQSDVLFAQLRATLSQLGWKLAYPTKQQTLSSAPLDAAGLESTLRGALKLPRPSVVLTVENISAALRDNQAWLDRAEHLHGDFDRVEKGKHDTQVQLKILLSSRTDLETLRTYVETGYTSDLARSGTQRVAIAILERQIGGLKVSQFEQLSTASASQPLAIYRAHLETRARDLRRAADLAQKFFDAFKADRGRAEVMGQELRALAERMLEHLPDCDSCPLCHTTFPTGELRNHIFQEFETNGATRELELASALSTSRRESETATLALRQVDQLLHFCRSRQLAEDQTTFGQALAALEEITLHLETLNIEFDSTLARLRTLEENGFESSTLAMLQQRTLGKIAEPLNPEVIQLQLVTIERKVSELEADFAQWEEQSSSIRSASDTMRLECGLTLGLSPQEAEDALRERSAHLQSLRNATEILSSVLTLEPRAPLDSIASTLNVASETQTRLRLAVRSEMAADSSIADARSALDAALVARQHASEALARYQDAERALDEVMSMHSLEAVSREVLKQNRTEVAGIFDRIHSPHEFQVCAAGNALLERVVTHDPIKLDQVSSGQRAAFALSLFLALNSRATRAPPIMLIDDPVAHVDDLNTLSFLDYLRDIAANNQRQIFFACIFRRWRSAVPAEAGPAFRMMPGWT
jgi:exonuclease SbcC